MRYLRKAQGILPRTLSRWWLLKNGQKCLHTNDQLIWAMNNDIKESRLNQSRPPPEIVRYGHIKTISILLRHHHVISFVSRCVDTSAATQQYFNNCIVHALSCISRRGQYSLCIKSAPITYLTYVTN